MGLYENGLCHIWRGLCHASHYSERSGRKRGWATEEEVMDYYAIGQCTPGIIAVNTSTFIGYKLKGILGGFVATFGFVFPSIIIITIIAAFIQNFAHLPYVTYAFDGIRACVCALILDAVVKLGKNL